MKEFKLLIGAMGSGKSAYLINEIKKSFENNKALRTYIFKPKLDLRDAGIVRSRNGEFVFAHEIESFEDILKIIDDVNDEFATVKHIFIDEIQFLRTDGLRRLYVACKKRGIPVTASGLDLTSELRPFNTTAKFMCYCDEIIMISGECEVCGKINSSRLSEYILDGKIEDFKVGDKEYIGTCCKCHKMIK